MNGSIDDGSVDWTEYFSGGTVDVSPVASQQWSDVPPETTWSSNFVSSAPASNGEVVPATPSLSNTNWTEIFKTGAGAVASIATSVTGGLSSIYSTRSNIAQAQAQSSAAQARANSLATLEQMKGEAQVQAARRAGGSPFGALFSPIYRAEAARPGSVPATSSARSLMPGMSMGVVIALAIGAIVLLKLRS